MDIVDRNDHEPYPEQARPDGEGFRLSLPGETDLLDDSRRFEAYMPHWLLAGSWKARAPAHS